ncbi:MAG: hypothetical protein IH885_04435 [Myxococcales bacterium]|nr:hypothetical protein [Myxococcales bacterium]
MSRHASSDYLFGIHNRPMPWDDTKLVSLVPLSFGRARILLSNAMWPLCVEDVW